MSQQQTSNAPTNADSITPVSFTDVSLTNLKSSFNDTYKVSKGSASQVVLGFQSMSERLQEPSNEYQQTLYPKLKELCERLFTKYVETFLTTFSNNVERQVYGANLNGNRNNGSLYRSIPSGVNRNLTYNYAQFGQLMRVLTSRLRFIAQRDPSSVQRYKESAEEMCAYQKLQTNVNTFLTFISELLSEWNLLVSETRTKFAPTQTESNVHSQRQFKQSHEYREQREYREHREYRKPRNPQARQSRQDLQHNNSLQNMESTTSGTFSRPQYKQVRKQPMMHGDVNENNKFGEWVTPRNTTKPRTVPKTSVTL